MRYLQKRRRQLQNLLAKKMITEAALAFLPIARNSIEEEYQQLIKRQAKEKTASEYQAALKNEEIYEGLRIVAASDQNTISSDGWIASAK